MKIGLLSMACLMVLLAGCQNTSREDTHASSIDRRIAQMRAMAEQQQRMYRDAQEVVVAIDDRSSYAPRPKPAVTGDFTVRIHMSRASDRMFASASSHKEFIRDARGNVVAVKTTSGNLIKVGDTACRYRIDTKEAFEASAKAFVQTKYPNVRWTFVDQPPAADPLTDHVDLDFIHGELINHCLETARGLPECSWSVGYFIRVEAERNKDKKIGFTADGRAKQAVHFQSAAEACENAAEAIRISAPKSLSDSFRKIDEKLDSTDLMD